MKVWVLEISYSMNEWTVDSVYDSQEKAIAAQHSMANDYEYLAVTEWEVQ